jgi:hypothetical protein
MQLFLSSIVRNVIWSNFSLFPCLFCFVEGIPSGATGVNVQVQIYDLTHPDMRAVVLLLEKDNVTVYLNKNQPNSVNVAANNVTLIYDDSGASTYIVSGGNLISGECLKDDFDRPCFL